MIFKHVILHLSVKDVKKSLEFYTSLLEFRLEFIQNDKNENPSFAILKRDNVELMIADKALMQHDLRGFEKISASVIFYIEMDDPDELYFKVKDKAFVLRPIEDTSWGTREFWITDVDNYIFSFFKK